MNLLLVDVSQSVRTETCLVFTTQHFYRSWDLSVVLCPGSVHVSQLCWKSSTFALGYTEATSFQKRGLILMNKCQFFMSDLRKKQWLLGKGKSALCFQLHINRYKLLISGAQKVEVLLQAGETSLELMKIGTILCYSTLA